MAQSTEGSEESQSGTADGKLTEKAETACTALIGTTDQKAVSSDAWRSTLPEAAALQQLGTKRGSQGPALCC